MTTAEWVNLLTPVAGPVLTAITKKLAPKIPKKLLPPIAVVLGAAANLIGSKAIAGQDPNFLVAALLGLAGVGVYEVAKPAIKTAPAVVPLLLAFCLFGLPASAADAAKPAQSYYGSEFSIDGFAGTATTDFNEGRGFYGFGANFFLNENFGVGASTSFTDLNGHFFDNVSLKGIYRVPIDRTALYGFAGGLRELDADKWGVTLGGGVEHRFAKYFSLFGEIGMEKFVDIDPVALGKVGVRIPLSFK